MADFTILYHQFSGDATEKLEDGAGIHGLKSEGSCTLEIQRTTVSEQLTSHLRLTNQGFVSFVTTLQRWTSIYQLFGCSPGVQGFDTLPYAAIRKNRDPAQQSISQAFFPTNQGPLEQRNRGIFAGCFDLQKPRGALGLEATCAIPPSTAGTRQKALFFVAIFLGINSGNLSTS